MNINFDLISNLNLTMESKFDWSGKPTSLFCIIPGNISNDLRVIHRTLTHLSTLYQGVFYIDGELEQSSIAECKERTRQLTRLCRGINNIVYLHNNVIIMNGVAVVGINGWYGVKPAGSAFDKIRQESYKTDDIKYLQGTIKKMQIHVEVRDIVILSSTPPDKQLTFDANENLDDLSPNLALIADTEKKTKCWVFNSDKMVDTTLGGIRYVSNPYKGEPYWAKRIEIEI